jgi:6-bladed beta-propeller
MRNAHRCRPLAVAATLAITAAGCGGATGSVGSKSASAAGPNPASVPNPFKIVARYSASSLGLRNPLDLAVGPDGNVYVTDASDRVAVLSPAGKALRRWGKRGNGRGEFSFADPSQAGNLFAPIAVGRDGKVYVADRGNHRVEVFSSRGKFIRQIGSFGAGPGQFIEVGGLAVDSAGDVYVADDQQGTISKFSPAGRFEWSIGGPAASDPDLQGQFLLANVDAHGRVVAGVNGTERVVYIDATGHKLDSFGVNGYFRKNWGPCNVTVDSQGNVAVESCPDAGQPVPGVPSYRATLLFDRTHRLIGAWYGGPFSNFVGPHFGPRGEAFAIDADLHTGHPDGSILKLKVALPGA